MAAIATLVPFETGEAVANRLMGSWGGQWFDFARDWSDADVRHSVIEHHDGPGARYQSDRWTHARIANSAGLVFVVLANGRDAPIRYDGHRLSPAQVAVGPEYLEAVGDPSLVPPFDARRLRHVVQFKNRLWWSETSGTTLWYGRLDAPGGDLFPFNVGIAGEDAGDVAALGKISHDGGDGPDDYLVILFESGWAVIYQGSDPDDLDAFGIVGRFFVGQPLGDRPLLSYGGDVLAITKLGVIPVSKRISGSGIDESDYVTDAIRGYWVQSVRRLADADGWEGILNPDGSSIIINVPDLRDDDGLGVGVQLVLDVTQKAWCVYRGQAARTWGSYEGGLYYAHSLDPTVHQAELDDWYGDDDVPIQMLWRAAYSYMPNPAQFGVSEGGEGLVKRIHGVVPQMEADGGTVRAQVGVTFDFQRQDPRQWSNLTVPEGPASRRRIPLSGAGQAAALVVRSHPEARDFRAGLRIYNMLVEFGIGQSV